MEKKKSQPGQIVCETPISKKTTTKKGLVEWLKAQALSSNPSTAHTQKKINEIAGEIPYDLLKS
jgi:hypothetical protein